MSRDVTIGLVVPFATDDVPFEGPIMYPGVRFLPRGVGVRALTPEGYEAAWNGIVPAAEYLAQQGVDAIMVIGTSLTFYRGPAAHAQLLKDLRERTGLPVSTMSQALIDGLREVGAKRVAVATAYTDVVNRRLKELLQAAGIEVLSLECFNLLEFNAPQKMSEAEIISLSDAAVAKANAAKPAGRRSHPDLLRRPAYARRRRAAGGKPRYPGRVLRHGGILGGDAAGRRQRPYHRLRQAVRAIPPAGELGHDPKSGNRFSDKIMPKWGIRL